MEEVLQFLRQEAGVWALVVVFVAAGVEYFIPILPGDSIVLAGSLLVVAGVWSYETVAAVAIAGGFCGAAAQYVLGRLLLDERGSLRGGHYIERALGRGALDRFFELFRRHGMWVIALNRMFPGVRGVAFLAAGAAKLPPIKTLAFGMISNVGWSLAVLGAGVAVGGNWRKIEQALGVYQWVVLGLMVLAAIAYALIRRRRRRRV